MEVWQVTDRDIEFESAIDPCSAPTYRRRVPDIAS